MPAGLQASPALPGGPVHRADRAVLNLYHITDPVQFFNKQAICGQCRRRRPRLGADTTGTTASTGSGEQRRSQHDARARRHQSDRSVLSADAFPVRRSPKFVLERSFTPRTNGILSSFIVARRWILAHYGQLVVYDVPDVHVPSPCQAATAIESDPVHQQGCSRCSTSAAPRSTRHRAAPTDRQLDLVRAPDSRARARSQTFPRYRFVAASLGDRQFWPSTC